MLVRTLIEFLCFTAIWGIPFLVWYGWRYGVVELMRLLGLHSDEDERRE